MTEPITPERLLRKITPKEIEERLQLYFHGKRERTVPLYTVAERKTIVYQVSMVFIKKDILCLSEKGWNFLRHCRGIPSCGSLSGFWTHYKDTDILLEEMYKYQETNQYEIMAIYETPEWEALYQRRDIYNEILRKVEGTD